MHFLHHLFIPSHRNNFRAKLLHLDFLFVLVLTVVTISSVFGRLEESDVLGIAKDIRIDQLFQLTNEARTSQGLPPLKYSNQLQFAAQNKGQYMLSQNCWAHFCGSKSPWNFILDAGYSYEVAGENLAKGFLFSDGVVDGWRNSPTHWANIIKPEYDEVGFAVMNGTLENEETTLVVQMFGKRLAEADQIEETIDTQAARAQEVKGIGPKPVEASGLEADKPATSAAPKNESAYASDSSATKTAQLFSLGKLKFNWSTFTFGLLLFVLIIDLYIAHKRDLIRLTGKNIAHIIFIIALIIGLLIIRNGVIL